METGDKEMDEKNGAGVFAPHEKVPVRLPPATGETDSQLSYQSAMTNVSIQNALECKFLFHVQSVVRFRYGRRLLPFHPQGGCRPNRRLREESEKGNSKDKAVAVLNLPPSLSRKEKLKAKSSKSKAQIEKFRAWIEKKTAEASDGEEDEKKDASANDENMKESAKSEKKDDGHEAEPMDAA